MELYGSLSNISGSVSASYFTGSYIGDGAGLYNLPASGVTGLNLSQIASGSVTASVTPDGFNVNTSTSITGSLNVSGTVLSQTTPLVSGSSQINITGTTGYSTFSSSIATTDSNQESRLNLIETSTGSLNSFSSSIDTTIKNKLNIEGVISGSSQILNGSNIVSSSAQVTAYGFATTGSNLFIGNQTHSGSILPSVDNAYDLGSPTYQWRDVYISSGSLYIDGTKVLSSTAQELTITTDNGQSIKILEGTTDSIILQTADGDIELKSSADGDILLDPTNGKIMLKGPIEVFNGNKIQSSVGGTPVVFANDIVVSGSIELTGTVDGIDLTVFSSSLNGRLGSLESSGGSLNSFTASAINRLNALETTTSSLNSYTSSNNTRLNTIESTTGSLNSYTSSTNTKLSSIETTTSSIISVNTTQNSRLDSLETTSGSILSTNTAQSSRLDSIEGKTGSYATTGSNIFQGSQTITGSLYISQNLIVGGSSSIQNISSSQLDIGTNLITVNTLNPGIRFGGLAVIDSGSSPTVSGSILFDSVNDQWLFVHQAVVGSPITSSVLLMGPQTYNSLGSELYPTTNRIVKSVNAEHLGDSNISDNGTTVTILSNAVVNGTFSATGTTLVSGSSQINHNTTTNYDANQHIDHTTVSITAGSGLSGGGTIASNRTLTLDTGSVHFLDGVKKELNTEGVVSGSSQISFNGITNKPALVSGSAQISFNGITDKPTLVSGSSQITYGSISGIPGGIVSGSAQVDLTNTTNYSSGIKTRLNAEGVLSGSAQVVASLPAGTVSGSSQITYGSISGIPSGIVSGSSQVSFGSISGVPSGLVSGSSQITLSSTSGFSTYLDQAVKSGSTVTFSTVTATTFTGALSGNATSATSATSATNSTNAGYLGTADLRTIAPNSHDAYKLKFGFTSFNNNNTSPYADYLHLRSYSDNSGGSDNLVMFSKSGIGMRIWQQTFGSATAYSSYKDVAWTDGTNSSGTWGIRITGFANAGAPRLYSTDSSYNYDAANPYYGYLTYDGTRWLFQVSPASPAAVRVAYADSAGSASSASSATNSSQLGGYSLDGATSVATRIFNNKGQTHSTYTNFNTVMTPGPNYIQGPTNGPTGTAGGQWYGFMFGLGSEYGTSTGSAGHYASQLYYSRIGQDSNQYLWARDMESGTWGSWRKLYAGYADTAGTAGNITAYTINQNLGTSNNVKFGSHCDLNISSAAFRFYDGSTFRGGLGTDDWAHSGSAANITLFATGVLHFTSGGSKRAYFDSSGHLLPQANNTYNLGSTSLRWANLYTNDLHLSNEGKEGGNEIDGTTGNWTIQEGEENLYIINNKNGKKFKIDLTEIV